MKIGELLTREPFGRILEATLASFLKDRFGAEFRVTWYPRNPGVRAIQRAGQQAWVCSPALNAIVVYGEGTADVLNVVRRAFAVTPRRWRRSLQAGYVRLATHPRLVARLAPAALGIRPAVPGAESLLIMGGNNKIRVLDVSARRVWEVLKVGFDPAFVSREVDIRRAGLCRALPALKGLAVDKTWFEQAYVDGVAINRLPGTSDRSPLVAEAFAALYDVIDATRRLTGTEDYVSELTGRITGRLQRSALLTADDKREASCWIDRARGLVTTLVARADRRIPLATSHGDFQEGNILFGDGRVWLVDWEHSAERQSVYDALVFGLQSRFPAGLAGRLKAFVDNPRHVLGQLPASWADLRAIGQDAARRLAVTVFILEELDWNLGENSNPLFLRPSGAWLPFRAEMAGCLTALAEGST